jgi:microcompartment protein CcmL/EutN
MNTSDPALGLIELTRIARGLPVVDAVAQKAPVTILQSAPLSAGKYMVVFSGEVACVEESLHAGLAVAGDALLHHLLIPNLHPEVPRSLRGPHAPEPDLSLGILETGSVASAVIAADGAAKMAEVKLIHLHLANGIGGKAYFTMAGELGEVEAAIECAAELAGDHLIEQQVVPRPHPDTVLQFAGGGGHGAG